MPRLWFRKLTSIGAVPEGDNPDAQIVLFKAKKGVALVDETDQVVVDVEEGPDAAQAEAIPEAGDDEGIAKRIEAAEEEIRKAREERDAALWALADEVKKARRALFVVKARNLEPLLGPAEEVAPTLEALDATDPEAFAALEKRLGAALERLNLTKELGTAGVEGADPVAKRDAWVKRYVLDHPEIPEWKARDMFWKANPEALEAQREEQG